MATYNGVIIQAMIHPMVELVKSYIDIDVKVATSTNTITVKEYGSLEELSSKHGFKINGDKYDMHPMRGRQCIVTDTNGDYSIEYI